MTQHFLFLICDQIPKKIDSASQLTILILPNFFLFAKAKGEITLKNSPYQSIRYVMIGKDYTNTVDKYCFLTQLTQHQPIQ